MGKLYKAHGGALGTAGLSTLEELRSIEQLRNTKYVPDGGADYGDDYFAGGLLQVARLIKARVGLKARASAEDSLVYPNGRGQPARGLVPLLGTSVRGE